MITPIQHRINTMPQKNSKNFSRNTIKNKNSITNDHLVLNLLKKELQESMPEAEANIWVSKIKQICIKHSIKLENLPINEKCKGSLSKKETHNIFTEIFYSVFAESNAGKIELKADK